MSSNKNTEIIKNDKSEEYFNEYAQQQWDSFLITYENKREQRSPIYMPAY